MEKIIAARRMSRLRSLSKQFAAASATLALVGLALFPCQVRARSPVAACATRSAGEARGVAAVGDICPQPADGAVLASAQAKRWVPDPETPSAPGCPLTLDAMQGDWLSRPLLADVPPSTGTPSYLLHRQLRL